MSKIEVLFQGIVENDFHIDAIKKLSGLDDVENLIFCVAFARSEGIDLVLDAIDVDASKIRFYLGVRNGITSVQVLHILIKKQIETFCIDTGSSGVLFHPKIYLSNNKHTGYAVIGSANLTQSGLTSNIETSFFLEFDLLDRDDKSVYQLLKDSVINIPTNYPKNTRKIGSARNIISMLWNGIITDERIIRQAASTRKRPSITSAIIPPIKSFKKNIQKPKKRRSSKEVKKLKKQEITTDEDWVLMWESRALTERDLNIPTGPNTNPTGSMLFKKGNMEGIDQRHYFRGDVFNELNWTHDPAPRKSHLERAEAIFLLEIKGINYGTYKLGLTHNSRTDSAAYRQKNSMTEVHWGAVRELIAKNELLGEQLKLYKLLKATDSFKIEIG